MRLGESGWAWVKLHEAEQICVRLQESDRDRANLSETGWIWVRLSESGWELGSLNKSEGDCMNLSEHESG